MHYLDWTSDRTLEGEKLAIFAVIPIVVFVCTFWLVIVDKTAIFTMLMLASIASTVLITNGVPEDVRTQVISLLQFHADKAKQ